VPSTGVPLDMKIVHRPMDLMSRVTRGLHQHRIAQDFGRYLRSRPPGYGLFSDDRSEYPSTLLSQIPCCDVINLHWISGCSPMSPSLRAFTRLKQLEYLICTRKIDDNLFWTK
jgi:hypothetical protein